MKTAALLSCFAMATSTVAQQKNEQPSTGILCLSALVGFSVEVGKSCLPSYNSEGQVRLQNGLKTLESRLSSSEGWNQARVEEFMKVQAKRGAIDQPVCKQLEKENDTIKLAKNFIDVDAGVLDQDIDRAIKIAGPHQWGDCL
jgi:hypothetical protein